MRPARIRDKKMEQNINLVNGMELDSKNKQVSSTNESVYAKIGELLDYGKLSAIHLLKLPKIEKQDVSNFIKCLRYEKAQTQLKQKMERYQGKVERCIEALQESHRNIESMKARRDELNPGSGWWVDETDAQSVARYNDRLNQTRKMTDKIEYAIEKHNDLVDKRTEAEEEAREKLEELTLEALSAIDEDILMVINRLEGIVSNLADSDDAGDLIAAIDVCLMGLRIYAMFEDLIDDNSARKECKESITKINQTFSTLCANDSVQNYMINIYRRNLDLVQKNAGISNQIDAVLVTVDQKQMDTLSKSIDVVLTEQIETKFDYSSVIDPAEIDKIVDKITKAIDSLKLNIEKAKAFQVAETPAVELGKVGTEADQKAKSLRIQMQTNVDALDSPLTQNHFAVQIIDEAVIEEFYQKDLKVSIAALRKHIIDTIGEQKFEDVLKGGDDRFSLNKAQIAIDKANLSRLQSTLDKIPDHIKGLTEKITSATSDIQRANEVPKKNADALSAELSTKYIMTCIPVIGLFSAIGIRSRVKTFEPAFRNANQIYKELGNALLEKNKKMNKIVMIVGIILGLGSLILFAVSDGPTAISVIMLATYVITALMLFSIGKQIKSFLGVSVDGKS